MSVLALQPWPFMHEAKHLFSDPDFLLNSGKTGQFILTLGNFLLSATKVRERAEILLLFFERAYLQLKFARAVCLNSITCWRNTAHCNIESKQPPIGVV